MSMSFEFVIKTFYLHIFAKLDGFDLVAKGELANALELMVVPEHHFVRGPLRAAAPSYQRQYITPK